jgi:hypothetical protein
MISRAPSIQSSLEVDDPGDRDRWKQKAAPLSVIPHDISTPEGRFSLEYWI